MRSSWPSATPRSPERVFWVWANAQTQKTRHLPYRSWHNRLRRGVYPVRGKSPIPYPLSPIPHPFWESHMKLYYKFLLSLLPLFLGALLVVNATFYYLMRPPLLASAQEGLEIKADDVQKFMDDYYRNVRLTAENTAEEQQKLLTALTRSTTFNSGRGVFVWKATPKTLYGPSTIPLLTDSDAWVWTAAEGWPNKRRGGVSFGVNGVPYVGHYYYFEPWDWYIITAEEEAQIYHQANRAFQQVLGVQSLLGGLITLLLMLVMNSMLRPIYTLKKGVEQMRRGDLHSRIVVSTRDELQDLAVAINSMAAELESTLVDLRENEARYRTLFNQANDGIFVFDPRTRQVVDVNQKAEEILGYPAAALRQMVLDDFYPPSARPHIPAEPILHKTREAHVLHQDGRLIPVEFNTTLLTLGGQPYYLSHVRDVRLRKEAEQMLRRREAVLSAVNFAAEQLFMHPWPDVIAAVLAELGQAADIGRVTFFINQMAHGQGEPLFRLHTEWVAEGLPPLEPIHDYEQMPVTGSPLGDWFEPMSRGEFLYGLVQELPEAQQPIFRAGGVLAYAMFPIVVQGKLWGTLTFADYATPRPWQSPELDALSTAARTLSAAIQRQQAEEELRWSEERFRLFGQNINHVLWIIDTRGHIVYLSPAFKEIWGIDPEYIYAHQPSWLSFIHPDDYERIKQADERTATHGFDEIFRIMRPDGSIRWVRDRAFPLLNEQGTRFGEVGIAEDVTERLAAEEAMREVQRMESIGILAGGIAHDFNNLLTSMLGQASLVQYKLGEGHPALANVQKVIKSAERAADLTRQLLAYAGKGNFQIQPLNLHALLRENVELLELALPKKAHLTIQLDPQLEGGVVQADRGQLQQVVMNLVINAAEAIDGEQGQVLITTQWVELTPETQPRCVGNSQLQAGRYVCLHVQDTGRGMDGETQQRIFDPFFTTKQHGRGLGLSATLGIVQTHGGGLCLESELGQGTTFTVYLPISFAAEVPSISQPLATPPARRGKVLVIDDEAPVREAVADILEMMGIEVLPAADGREGVAVYARQSAEISLVLLDMQMPHLNGPDTYVALRQINPEVRVVISSGYGEAEASRLFAVDGSLTFLQKPYDVDQLMQLVSAELGHEDRG